ncbi:MAG: RNA polymerase subunit sigma-24 [Anaerolinea sp.]|nr:RNA polymerase subunit sigma-24 [Anaerolinea sp.]
MTRIQIVSPPAKASRKAPPEESSLAILPATRPAVAAPEYAAGVSETALLKRRDQAAWAAMFEREHPLVFRSVFAQVGDRTTAEDITAQVFLEAIEGIGRYRHRGRPITAWLHSIARHRSTDWFRKKWRETGEIVEPVVDGPEQGLEVALAALSMLTSEQREVVHLRFVEDLSIEEVAAITGRSMGAVKAMQHRALARLRTILGEETGWRTR